MGLTYGSVCSGIEAASVAWHHMGWQPAWFAEIDPAASKVLAHHWPHVANLGDMTTIAARVRAREIAAPDVLVGGTPCQSFSFAGLRGGLQDARGQLTIAFIDLADAIDEVRATQGKPPCIIVWENVPGVLSHNDNPLGCFLAGLAGDDAALEPGPRPEPGRSSAFWTWDKASGDHRAKWSVAGAVAGPQRAIAWIVKDAQYFGLAQRRRRVFLVASARTGFDPAGVLLEFEGVRRDSAPSREAREDVAHATAGCLTGSGRGSGSGRGVERPGDTRGQDPVVAVYGPVSGPAGVDFQNIALSGDTVGTLDTGLAHGNRGYGVMVPSPTWWDGSPVSQTLDAVLHKGQTMPEKNRFPAVLQPMAVEAYRIPGNMTPYCTGDRIDALTSANDSSAQHVMLQPIAIQAGAVRENPESGPDGVGVRTDGIAYTLEARSEVQILVFDTTQITSPGNYSSPKPGDPCHPLAATAHVPSVCITGDITHTLKADGFDASEDGTGRGQPVVLSGTHYRVAVRRIMPVEAERLQGFPDNHTLVPINSKGKLAADGPRYKQLGNSMAVPCMRWIGERIQAQLNSGLNRRHNGGPPLDDYEDLLG